MSGPQLISVRVVEAKDVTSAIKRFRLEALDGRPLPEFSAGAHISVEIDDGSVVHRNAYSLMSSPRDLSAYVISVRRDDGGRGGSRLLHTGVSAGAVLHIGPPVNLFPLAQRARKHLLIAGGIGITPLLALGDQLLHDQKPFELNYAVRSTIHGAYLDEVRQRFGRHVNLYISDLGQRLLPATLLKGQPLGTHLYMCGPARMIDAIFHAARGLGWPESALHAERFSAPAVGEPYEVQLALSGLTVPVGTNQSMLEAIEAAGVAAPYLCRGGVCGQCETRVLSCEGFLLHADHVLTDAQKASGTVVMPCVSRFEGKRLLLDL